MFRIVYFFSFLLFLSGPGQAQVEINESTVYNKALTLCQGHLTQRTYFDCACAASKISTTDFSKFKSSIETTKSQMGDAAKLMSSSQLNNHLIEEVSSRFLNDEFRSGQTKCINDKSIIELKTKQCNDAEPYRLSRNELLTDCKCSAEKFLADFSKAPFLSIDHFTKLGTNSLSACTRKRTQQELRAEQTAQENSQKASLITDQKSGLTICSVDEAFFKTGQTRGRQVVLLGAKRSRDRAIEIMSKLSINVSNGPFGPLESGLPETIRVFSGQNRIVAVALYDELKENDRYGVSARLLEVDKRTRGCFVIEGGRICDHPSNPKVKVSCP